MSINPSPNDSSATSRRVVVTGMGVVSPVGSTVQDFWTHLIEGRSGIRPVSGFDTAPFATRIAGEAYGFQPELYLEPKELRLYDRFLQFAIAASTQALQQSGYLITESNAERTGVYIGSGFGGISTLLDNHKQLLDRGARRVSPFMVPMMIPNMASGQVSIRFGAQGPNSSPATACATGNNAIGDAFHLIRSGRADVMLAGGTEAPICELSFAGFSNMKAMSTRSDAPERASRPFDLQRDGFVMSEGAGVLLLEELNGALRRGVPILAEIIGYGLSADAYHMTAPDPEGSGAYRAMAEALRDAGLTPGQVDYINAHATGTPLGDQAETAAIQRLFGEHAHQLSVSSTKSVTGHLFGAAGGIEAVATVRALQEGLLPPTINYESPDPTCDLDYIPNVARAKDIRVALSNGFGFGGHNAVIALRKYEP
ncbi:beta-ketoacyl-ACP synthase II [Paenibacillus silviterrae]|uniref:beta-ketoacyl-ACP synthase II n=1 Tax=Paenibacillus silviterrae TaxID=3242194 RepID=UPI0025427C43|nr:beta-ketoacyl-ACP synthase II [Paenibacillus chinjuensis]